MIHRWKLSLIPIPLLLIAGLIYAQTRSGDSPENGLHSGDEKAKEIIALIRSLYEELSTPDPKSTCRLTYAVEVTSRGLNDSLLKRKSDVRFTGDAGHFHVESDSASLFQDGSLGVAVNVPDKEIRIFPSSPAALEARRRESMKTFREELFTRSAIAEHQVAGEEHRLVLVPPDDFREWYGIERTTIVVRPAERRLVSIQADFGVDGMYESMRMSYGRAECSDDVEANRDFAVSAFDRVFDANGRPRSAYSDYRVIDLRSR